jgi:hypothetical protein
MNKTTANEFKRKAPLGRNQEVSRPRQRRGDKGKATIVCSLPGHPFVVNQGQAIGANNIAIALFSFPSLATYEEYRSKIGEDED